MKTWHISVLLMVCMISSLYANNVYQLSMMAQYEVLQGRSEKAFAYYQELMPQAASPYAYKGLLSLLFSTNQFNAILTLMPQLESTFKNDLEVQIIFAQTLATIGQEQKADERFIALYQQHKGHAELAYLAAVAHSKTNPQKSIDIIDEQLNKAPHNPQNCIFYFLKSQFYLLLNNKQEAGNNAQKCVDLCPRFDKGWLFLGMVKEQEGNIKEAIDGYKGFLRLAGSNAEVELQIRRLLLQQKTEKKNQPSYVLPAMHNALQWYENKKYDLALHAIDQCLQAYPQNKDARLLKINILSAMNKPLTAVQCLQDWMMQEPDQELWYKSLHLLYKAGLKPAAALATLQAVEKQHPKTPLVQLYLADMYTRLNEFNQALQHHEHALKLVTDPLLKTKILTNMGVIYYQTEQYTAMKNVLEQGKKITPDFAPLNNLLAYYYATKGGNIALAQQCITLALAHDKNNPHFLDTQAMIWYKQHDYKKAEAIFNKLAQQQPNDYYIQLHAGKTYLKLNNSTLARKSLKKALELAPTPQAQAKIRPLLEQWQH